MQKLILVYLTHPHVEAWNFKREHKVLLDKELDEYEVKLCFHSKEFISYLPNASGAIVWFFKKEWAPLAKNLKWVATPAAGTEWIDLKESENLKVFHGGFHGPLIAESVLGAMLYFCKAFDISKEMQRKKRWARVKVSEKISTLHEARVTILGFGKIGQSIGRTLKPLGCWITGIKQQPAKCTDFFTVQDSVKTPDQLFKVLETTDHLISVLPGGNETQGLLTREHFERLPKTSCFYNVGRGNVCEESVLVETLRNGEIAGAYLDVFETEPLPETSLLWESKNVLIQPHLSAAAPQYLDLFLKELCAKLKNLK